MKRQDYYPSLIEEQVLWLRNFAHQLPLQAPRLRDMSAEQVADIVADALWIAYLLGPWREGSRKWASALRSAMDHAQTGKGGAAVLSLAFNPPPLPEGVTPRPPGALTRVFKMVQQVKNTPGYDDGMGELLGVLTRQDHREHTHTELKLTAGRSATGQTVVVQGRRWGHLSLLIQSRRGGGDWEDVGYVGKDKLVDKRPLLVPGQPEMREYRGRFWDGSDKQGEWSPVASITVGV